MDNIDRKTVLVNTAMSRLCNTIKFYRTVVTRWDALGAELAGLTANFHPSKPRRAKRGGKRNGRGTVQGRVLDMSGDFNAGKAAFYAGISTKHARVLLSSLTRRRLLKRVRRGVYRVGKGAK